MDGDKMESVKCKICGNPISDAYSKTELCPFHTKEKSRLIHFQYGLRAFTILSCLPLVVSLILALAGVQSELTSYFYVLWQLGLVLAGLLALYFVIYKLRDY
jgi:hypothetical protein